MTELEKIVTETGVAPAVACSPIISNEIQALSIFLQASGIGEKGIRAVISDDQEDCVARYGFSLIQLAQNIDAILSGEFANGNVILAVRSSTERRREETEATGLGGTLADVPRVTLYFFNQHTGHELSISLATFIRIRQTGFLGLEGDNARVPVTSLGNLFADALPASEDPVSAYFSAPGSPATFVTAKGWDNLQRIERLCSHRNQAVDYSRIVLEFPSVAAYANLGFDQRKVLPKLHGIDFGSSREPLSWPSFIGNFTPGRNAELSDPGVMERARQSISRIDGVKEVSTVGEIFAISNEAIGLIDNRTPNLALATWFSKQSAENKSAALEILAGSETYKEAFLARQVDQTDVAGNLSELIGVELENQYLEVTKSAKFAAAYDVISRLSVPCTREELLQLFEIFEARTEGDNAAVLRKHGFDTSDFEIARTMRSLEFVQLFNGSVTNQKTVLAIAQNLTFDDEASRAPALELLRTYLPSSMRGSENAQRSDYAAWISSNAAAIRTEHDVAIVVATFNKQQLFPLASSTHVTAHIEEWGRVALLFNETPTTEQVYDVTGEQFRACDILGRKKLRHQGSGTEYFLSLHASSGKLEIL